jgi:CCR4-NOT transcription complex subunit 7/8
MGGLQRLADELGCQRLGAEHQAGSDSLLTMAAYFALARVKFTGSDGKIGDSKYINELFGYGNNHTVRKGGGPVLAMRESSAGNISNNGSES